MLASTARSFSPRSDAMWSEASSIHVWRQVYDVWAFNLGPFPEAWTVSGLYAGRVFHCTVIRRFPAEHAMHAPAHPHPAGIHLAAVHRGRWNLQGINSTAAPAISLSNQLPARAPQIPILLAPIWLLYGYVAPILDEYVGDSATATAQ